jgi:hypothetical protein
VRGQQGGDGVKHRRGTRYSKEPKAQFTPISELMWQRYTGHQMHRLLCLKAYKGDCPKATRDDCERQALRCPYYVPLRGVLGSDWGLIVNPFSDKFGQVVFEHDWCGCDEVHTPRDSEQTEDEWLMEDEL